MNTNIFQVSQYGVKTVTSSKVELSFGKIDCIQLGEQGRGRKLTLIPCPEGELGFVLNGVTRSNNPRLNSSFEHPLVTYLVWKFEAGFRGSTIPIIDDPNVQILASGYCAQGDAGRMGGHDEYLLKVLDDCVLRCSITGRTYGKPTEWVVIVYNNTVKVMPHDEYLFYLEHVHEV